MSWEVAPTASVDGPQVLRAVAEALTARPFQPRRGMTSAHLQTLLGSQLGGGTALAPPQHRVDLPDGAAVLTLRLAPDRTERLVMVHGMGGDLQSAYMRASAHLALEAGLGVTLIEHYNVELLTAPRVFHAGSGDVMRTVVADEILSGAQRVVIAGVSLGGNVALSAAADWGAAPPPEVAGAVVLSPLVDLPATWPVLERKSNAFYVFYFLRALRAKLLAYGPEVAALVDLAAVRRAKTVRAFDEAVIVQLSEFSDLWHYYDAASAGPRLGAAELPLVLLHAADDPIIPAGPLFAGALRTAPHVLVGLTDRGGHAGFQSRGGERWADRALVEAATVLLRS